MDVGILLVAQNWYEDKSDEQVFMDEVNMGVAAEAAGFDSVWCAEHHFNDYSMVPDNFEILAYVAGKTERVKLGIGAAILPWNDPLRVVEKSILLDHLSEGRLILALGRGLAKMEYDTFGVPMDESRQRFNEAAEMVIRGLKTGVVEGDGPMYPQKSATVRPAPNPDRTWDDRIFAAAMSPDSIPVAADLGVRMMTFMQFDNATHGKSVNEHRELFKKAHGAYPSRPLVQDFVVCHEDPDEAERLAQKYIGDYFLSVIRHYDFAGSHWRDTKGYETYQSGADMIREAGMENAAAGYVTANIHGTPDQIVEQYKQRREEFGTDFQANAAFCFAGMPIETAMESMRLFGKEVVPRLKDM